MLYITFWNGYFNIRGTKEDPIPYITNLELTYISVQGGTVYPYESCDVLPLPARDESLSMLNQSSVFENLLTVYYKILTE